MIRIGIVGHRFLGEQPTVDFVTEQCISILRQMKKRYRNVVALSAIAEGADMIFAEAASSLNIPFEIVRPFEEYIQDFETPVLKDRYLSLQKMAVKEIRLPYDKRSEESYFYAMQWVVRNSDLLIAVWDGKEGTSGIGTAATVKEAIRTNSNWIHLDVTSKFTTSHIIQ